MKICDRIDRQIRVKSRIKYMTVDYDVIDWPMGMSAVRPGLGEICMDCLEARK
jgi:hypothetical protein